jgi:hypothetical protein
METQVAKSFAEVATAIHSYFAVLREPAGDDDSKLEQLIAALDGLLTAYHATADLEPSDIEFEYPQRELGSVGRQAAEAFPRLGMYACALEPQGNESQGIHFRDAICDLDEIADDMDMVLWIGEHVGEVDGLWEFRFGFKSHWGEHLTSVRHYLQTTLSAA